MYFLTNVRNEQHSKLMYILNNNILRYDDITYNCIRKTVLSAKDYVNLPYFKNWIVGFASAEGSFFIKSNNHGCFQIKQRLHKNLFEAFKLIFDTDRKITVDKDLYMQFSVSSKQDIQNVINYFSFSGLHPVIGLKGIQYLKWLKDLKGTIRYKTLTYPNLLG